jgi:hypothetical protein
LLLLSRSMNQKISTVNCNHLQFYDFTDGKHC